MKVNGNLSPASVSVSAYGPQPGYAEVRIRENVKEKTITDEDQTVTMFEYDEYMFHIPNRDGLQAEIENNLSAWLASGRSAEYNINCSEVQDMKTENGELYDILAETAEAEYTDLMTSL